ncbi:pilin [Patescibacteria group bacterium]|nr:pilin [Patescibacteria group bacterium]
MYLLTKLAKHRVILLVVATFAITMLVAPAVLTESTTTLDFGLKYGEKTGLGKQDIRDTIAKIINVGLGMLGVVAVVIMLWGGFRWMTAGGNDEKVGEARKIIFAGIIGLAIVLSAWAIARFVLEQLYTATTDKGAYTEVGL